MDSSSWFAAVDFDVLAKTLGAMACGAVIGIEREQAEKPAGIRTHALVGGASCLLLSLGIVLVTEFLSRFPEGALRADPAGVIEAVITGIAFLGAGTIIRGRGEHIEGLTTAASILFTAAIGIAIAAGRFGLAVALTAIVVLTLHVPRLFARG
jgi:putative Mg2+ transporter-C (MgtC) family protein